MKQDRPPIRAIPGSASCVPESQITAAASLHNPDPITLEVVCEGLRAIVEQ